MRFEAGSRRAALEGLDMILDAGGLEELFGGPDEEAVYLYHLLHEVTRGRSSSYYWEICRTGRRRGVTPEFVIDRASVLLASIEERRRTDIYRVLGVPPLASEDAIKQRWHEVAKQIHPDVGGDPSYFRQVKEAYEILRDDGRRDEYERFWLRAVGPIARLADGDDVPAMPAVPGIVARPQRERRVVMVAKRTSPPLTEPRSEQGRSILDAVGRLGEAHAELDRRLTAAGLGGVSGTQGVLERLGSLLAPLDRDELARARAEIDAGIASVERIQADLAALAVLKRSFA
jgi:hypothetical protein